MTRFGLWLRRAPGMRDESPGEKKARVRCRTAHMSAEIASRWPPSDGRAPDLRHHMNQSDGFRRTRKAGPSGVARSSFSATALSLSTIATHKRLVRAVPVAQA